MKKQQDNSKRRRRFSLRNKFGDIIAHGVIYDQGNVQVLWRQDTGWGGEQIQTTANLLNLMPNVRIFKWED